MRRVLLLARKEITQLRRDKRLLPLVFVAPIIQLIMFGYVVQTEVKNIGMAVVDNDHTIQSRSIVQKFTNSKYFVVKENLKSEQDVKRLLRSEQATIAVIIPKGFQNSIKASRTAEIMIIVDGSNATVGMQAQQYATQIVAEQSRKISDRRLQSIRAIIPNIASVDPRIRIWYNPDLKSVNYMIPALIGLILTIITTIVTAVAIVRERERGTLEQLIVTPIKRWELIVGKTLPFVSIAFIEVVLIVGLGVLWFGVPFRGSVFVLLLLCIAFLFTTVGMGLLASTLSRNMYQAQMTAWLFLMPSILLSGFIFPIENMPRIIQPLTYLIPLRYFLIIVRGIFLKGVGLAELWEQVAILSILGIAIIAVSVLRFQKRFAE